MLDSLYAAAWLAGQEPLTPEQRALASRTATRMLVEFLAAKSDAALSVFEPSVVLDTWLHALLESGRTPAQVAAARRDFIAASELAGKLGLTHTRLSHMVLDEQRLEDWITDALRTGPGARR